MKRKFKIFYVDTSFIETIINWKQAEFLFSLPVFKQLPKDATFHHVHYDSLRQALGLVVHSKEYDVVVDGNKIPEVDGVLGFETIQLKVEGEGEAIEKTIRIVLDGDDFRRLISGGIVSRHGVVVLLSDIESSRLKRIL